MPNLNPSRHITIMGSFVADLAFRTPRIPAWGETILGASFVLGPGGKGSNQAVAAARAGGSVTFLCKLGRDTFGDLARRTYAEEGIDTQFVFDSAEQGTGAAAIIIDEARGENAIIVVPGSVAEHGLKLARSLGVTTILNPAPAVPLPETIFALCDYLTPNESEAAALTGLPVGNLAEAERAADALLARGVRNVVITLGAQGAFVKNSNLALHVPAVEFGAVVETTGAGDAFSGGFAVALSEDAGIATAARFGCAVAGISVTRRGTAPSMPTRAEVDALLEKNH
jgi:ribokinase